MNTAYCHCHGWYVFVLRYLPLNELMHCHSSPFLIYALQEAVVEEYIDTLVMLKAVLRAVVEAQKQPKLVWYV